MTRQQQYKFVRELIGNVQATVLAKLAHIPEEWDGHELRQYIAEAFELQAQTIDPRSKRMRDYKNAVLIHNL